MCFGEEGEQVLVRDGESLRSRDHVAISRREDCVPLAGDRVRVKELLAPLPSEGCEVIQEGLRPLFVTASVRLLLRAPTSDPMLPPRPDGAPALTKK